MPSGRTVGDWYDAWRPVWQVEASTADTADRRWRVHLEPHWRPMQMNRVSTFTVQQWASAQIDAGTGRDTVRACVGLLSTCLAGAVRAGMLPANPCGGVRLPRATRREPRYLEREEVDYVAVELERRPTGLLFVDSRGGPLRREHVRRRMWDVAIAGLPEPSPRWHDLRHTAASWMVQAGVPIYEVSKVLGHANVTVTARYSHLGEHHFDSVLRALDSCGGCSC